MAYTKTTTDYGHTQKTDINNSLDFSIYQHQRRPKHDSIYTNDHKIKALTHSLAFALYTKRLQPENPFNDGIRNDNYYECLTDYDTNDDDNNYGNENTNPEYYNGHIHNNGTTQNINNGYNPSLPPCIKRMCTLTEFLPSPMNEQSTMAPTNTNGKHTQHNTSHNDYNKATTSPHHTNTHHNGNTTHASNLHPPSTQRHRLITKPSDRPSNATTAYYSNWQKLIRPIYRWTRKHLDSFFDLAEMACEWNINPG